MACIGAEASSICADNSDAIVITRHQVDCCLALPVECDLRLVGEAVLSNALETIIRH